MEAETAVPCFVRFHKQNRAWKNNNYIDFFSKMSSNFITQNHVFIHKINKFLPETPLREEVKSGIVA